MECPGLKCQFLRRWSFQTFAATAASVRVCTVNGCGEVTMVVDDLDGVVGRYKYLLAPCFKETPHK